MVVSQAVSKANAALMGNHGAITVGANLREAFYRAMLLEVAAQGLVAGTIVGKMRYLSREEVDTIRGLAKVEYRVSLLKQGK
jgi:L-fuculose-phosphate aldolase